MSSTFEAIAPFAAAEPEPRLNDWRTYHHWIERRLAGSETVLNVGCGAGRIAPFGWERYPRVRLIGADVDPAAGENPDLDEFVAIRPGQAWAIEERSVNLVLSRYVLEHVARPEEFLANVCRVLKPGGRWLFLTPNRLHPAMLVSRLLPHPLKQKILNRTGGVDEADVFPTCYLINTAARIRALAAGAGLALEAIETREFEPCGYLNFSWPTRLLGKAYHAAVTRTGLDAWFGAQIVGCFWKPAVPRETVMGPRF